MKKIAIIGYGFVGKAVDFGFSKNINKLIIDPKVRTDTTSITNDVDFIFIAVPTPMNSDGTQNTDILMKVLNELELINSKFVKIIKSTVLPSKLKEVEKSYSNVVYNPEFLKENSAEQDFINSEGVVLGGEQEVVEKVKELYKECSQVKKLNFYETNLISASFAKYAINSFLALKVAYFNQLFDLVEQENVISWDELTHIISHDSRIGSSHLQVPGPDNKRGFGGACFPKDTAALIRYANEINKDFSILETAVKYNNNVRKSYKKRDSREREQGVNYDFFNTSKTDNINS